MEIKTISERFDNVSEKYDSQRRFFIPCFDDYYGTSINFLASIRNDFKSILDLGAGTGLLTKYLNDYFKKADFTLVDVSDKMLEIARQRFNGFDNFKFLVCDYTRKLPEGKFDLITSALSIHHLDNEAKSILYSNIVNSLEEEGCLINLDQFNPSTKHLEEYYNKWWYDSIMKSGITDIDIESWLSRRALDKENTIDETKQLLINAGFSSVECIYSFMKFGVIIAFK